MDFSLDDLVQFYDEQDLPHIKLFQEKIIHEPNAEVYLPNLLEYIKNCPSEPIGPFLLETINLLILKYKSLLPILDIFSSLFPISPYLSWIETLSSILGSCLAIYFVSEVAIQRKTNNSPISSHISLLISSNISPYIYNIFHYLIQKLSDTELLSIQKTQIPWIYSNFKSYHFKDIILYSLKNISQIEGNSIYMLFIRYYQCNY